MLSIYFLVLYLSKIDFSLHSIRNRVINVENFPVFLVVYFEAKQATSIYLIDLRLMESAGKGHSDHVDLFQTPASVSFCSK